VDVARLGTVDKFQGQEAPVVICSCTSSSPEDAPRGMAFLYDPHRFINVATSRARSTVIVVASPQLFEPDCRTPQQMEWANLKGGKRRLSSDAGASTETIARFNREQEAKQALAVLDQGALRFVWRDGVLAWELPMRASRSKCDVGRTRLRWRGATTTSWRCPAI